MTAIIVPVCVKVPPHHEVQSRYVRSVVFMECKPTKSPLAALLLKLKQRRFWRQPELKPLPQPLLQPLQRR